MLKAVAYYERNNGALYSLYASCILNYLLSYYYVIKNADAVLYDKLKKKIAKKIKTSTV